MSLIKKCIINKDVSYKPIWLMRQAGRYLPEFREIRKKNQDFINLCLNTKLVPEITLQPIKRFDLDAAIIFSDILMIPYGFGQNVVFNKGLGPELGIIDKSNLSNINEKDFKRKLNPIYNSIKIGYEKALSSIVDANVTTMIAAIILFFFGSGPIKGFSVTLGLGIITSVFTALLITRLFIDLYMLFYKPKVLRV